MPTPKKNLFEDIDRWKELSEKIQTIRDWLRAPIVERGEQPPDLHRLNEYREKRHAMSTRIFRRLDNHPDLAPDADDAGFDHEDFHPNEYAHAGATPDAAQGTAGSEPLPGADDEDVGPGRDEVTGTGNKDETRVHKDETKITHKDPNRLAGKRGVDYQIITGPGGKKWGIWEVPLDNGKTFRARWFIPREDWKHYGIDEHEGRDMTKAQLARIANFGNINSVKTDRNEHPIQTFMERMGHKFGVAPSLLKNKGVMKVLFEAFMEKWEPGEILGALKQTDWYNKKTEVRANWILEKSDAQRTTEIDTTFQKLREFAFQEFGAVDYADYFSEDRLRQMAENAASGKAGWDETTAQLRITAKARRTPGTSAAVALEESIPNSALDVENKYAQLLDQTNQWWGYNTSDRNTLMRWAGDILNGQKSDAAFDEYLKKRALALHPYLPQDTPYLDFAGAFKGRAEQQLGTPLDFDDALFSDFSAKDDQGRPVKDQAITFSDFDRMVRKDPRFRSSPTAMNQAAELVSLLNAQFNGVGA